MESNESYMLSAARSCLIDSVDGLDELRQNPLDHRRADRRVAEEIFSERNLSMLLYK
ncbi:MAG: hypothetical protein ACLTTP_12680 [Alistipes ihumii]